MQYSPENLIQWSNLSSTLQSKIKNLESQASENERKIRYNKKSIETNNELVDQMDTKKTEIEKKINKEINLLYSRMYNIRIDSDSSDSTKFFIQNAKIGDTARISNKHEQNLILPKPLLIYCLVITTMDDLNTIDQYGLDQAAIYGKQLGFKNEIYNIKTATRAYKRLSQWKFLPKDLTQYIPNYTFLLNPITHKLYFYLFPKKYVDLSGLCDNNTGRREVTI